MIYSVARQPLPSFDRINLGDAMFVALALLVLYAEMMRQFLPGPIGGLLQHGLVLPTYACVVGLKLARGKLNQMDLWCLILTVGLVALSIIGSYSRGSAMAVISTVLLVKLAYISTLAAFFGLRRMALLIPCMATIQILGLVVNLGMPQVMTSLTPQVYLWLDRTDLVGFQLNVNRFGILGSLLFIWYVFLRPNAIMAGAMLACLLLSGSRSGLLLLILFFTYFAVRGSLWRQAVFLAFVLLAAFPISYILRDQIAAGLDFIHQSHMLQTSYIRFIMFAFGVDLALDYFPFGTGGGTYGSPLSLNSPIYYHIGIAHLPTVSEGHGINDSGIGSLLGEYGFSGFALVTICVGALLKRLAPDKLSNMDVVFLVLVFLLGSFFRAMISSYYYATLMVLLVVMLCLHKQTGKTPAASGKMPV